MLRPAAAIKTSNSFEPVREEEPEDEIGDEEYWEMEALRQQFEDERTIKQAFEQEFRAQAQEERALTLAAQAQCSVAGGAFRHIPESEPKTANSNNASSSGFWGHSM